MIGIVKDLLLTIINKIDSGNSNLSEGDCMNIITLLKTYTDPKTIYSKYSACKYLNISRATFDNYIRKGILPKGTHTVGFKELSWTKEDLDKFIKSVNNKK